jgi:thymidine phosphorylase
MSKKEGISRVTRETAGTVDTKQASAFTTGIFFCLMNQKRVHTLIFNLDQVGDHAHPIFGTISDIQLLQPFTWHFLTFKAEMG